MRWSFPLKAITSPLAAADAPSTTCGSMAGAAEPGRRPGSAMYCPPHPSGTLSAIDAAPQAGLIIVAHTGIDHLDSAAAVWKGIPLERPLPLSCNMN
jgi:hypothetical protein